MNLSADKCLCEITYWSNSYGMISRANGILNRLSNFDFNSKAKSRVNVSLYVHWLISSWFNCLVTFL